MADSRFDPEPISAKHLKEGFDCGQPSLNDWLIKRALRNHDEGCTHVRVIAHAGEITGYYGLAAATALTDAMPRAVRGGQSPNPVPAILTGRFVVDRRWQGQGMGKVLFRDALIRCVAASDVVGARAIVIHALDTKATAFYQRFDFIATTADPLTLYQSVQRVKAALPVAT